MADRKKKKESHGGAGLVSMPDIRYVLVLKALIRVKPSQIFAKPSIKSDGPNALDFIGDQNRHVADVILSLDTAREREEVSKRQFCLWSGQLGHMRTNKNCPKYGEDVEARAEIT
ncbi:hypothetical protein HAX54_007837 [Datura stramonium]|uniref:Uncharacterized protein n=1 Tax=Datura stramonium TaxID=4076 RepID=A0ABS8RV40_DATST|nr:hypothetical protein [Datura stramonium]